MNGCSEGLPRVRRPPGRRLPRLLAALGAAAACVWAGLLAGTARRGRSPWRGPRPGTPPTAWCGLVALHDPKGAVGDKERLLRELCERLHHRGPDGSGYAGGRSWAMAHRRLAIMDPEHGVQPLERGSGAAVANGELYNFRDVLVRLVREHGPQAAAVPTGSDCEVLLPAWRALGADGLCNALNGMFAFVLQDGDGANMLAARDHCGIKPLYIGRSHGGAATWFASELKALVGVCDEAREFPPGYYWTPEGDLQRWYLPQWDAPGFVPSTGSPAAFRAALEKAVKAQLMSDVGIGLLLSGGVDSAIVGEIMAPLMREADEPLRSFTVGQPDSPDILAARKIAEHMGSEHHEYLFTSEEAFEALETVVYHLETYEPELVRSAVPNFFLAKLVASHGCKTVLTGEGSDELTAGYLYFRDAPSSSALFTELKRIFWHLHNVNNQRSDRMSMAHGVEARVPFLCPDVIAAAMNIDAEDKMITPERPEKAMMRELFAGEVPSEVLWRTKAMQCEGVGKTWVGELQALCAEAVSDEDFAAAAEHFPVNPPQSKEEYLYRRFFNKHFPCLDASTQVWEGGCRAGGAAWKSGAYTRAGLVDTSQLMSDDGVFRAAPRVVAGAAA